MMRKKPILFHPGSKKRKKPLREVIGLTGTHHGTGVTYTGLMLAFYFGEELGKKTALLECNTHHDFQLLQNAYRWEPGDDASFSYQEITCFKDVTEKQIAKIMAEDFEYLILDFGIDLNRCLEEYIRCDTRVVIGGKALWEQQKLITFCETVRNIKGNERWMYFIPNIKSMDRNELRRKLERNIYAVPFETNPMILSKKTYQMFQELFP